jgi:prepilin peptidase CpaA
MIIERRILAMLTEIILLFFFPGLMAYSAASDLITMTIPNKISIFLISGFFIFALISGMDWPNLGLHILAGTIVLIICFGMFALGWIGGGDAKLASATCLWFGFADMGEYLAYSAVFGGMLTLAILQLRHFQLPQFVSKWGWLIHLHDKKTGIPYGIALAAAALSVFPQSSFWHFLIGKTLLS